MKEKFHEGEKQNLSKTVVRYELFWAFQVGMLKQFWFSLLWENSNKRFVLRKKHKKYRTINWLQTEEVGSEFLSSAFGSSSFIAKEYSN